METNTIFIAKKQRLIVEAFCQYCTSLGLEVIGSSTNGEDALHRIERDNPTYAIIEASPTIWSGLERIKQLKQEKLIQTHTILYLQSDHSLHLNQALALRVNSILFAEDGIDKLTNILLKNKMPYSLYQKNQMGNPIAEAQPYGDQDLLTTLTPAQLKILSLVGTHKTMPEIAQKLFISPHTVNNHVANIRRKLDLQGRGVVLKYALAIKHRLVEVDGKVILNTYPKYSNAG